MLSAQSVVVTLWNTPPSLSLCIALSQSNSHLTSSSKSGMPLPLSGMSQAPSRNFSG
jgi:hypothetical protein